MALAKGTNSYVTLEEANAYFGDRLDVDAWTSATDELKEQALVTATSMLDTFQFLGYVADTEQLLAFPRVGQYFDTMLGRLIIFSDTDSPGRIVRATYEQAYHLLNNDGLLDDVGTVEDLNVSSIKLIDIKDPPKFSSTVFNLIKPLFSNCNGGSWWRAN